MFFNDSLVAIDIGSSAIKMLLLSGKGMNRSLKIFAMEVLPYGAIEHGNVMDPGVVVNAIKKLVNKMGVKGRKVSLSVSGSGVIIKKVRISEGKDATVDEQVNFHASQAFQLDLSDLYYDYAEMGPVQGDGSDIDVLLTGARREVIEQYVSVVKNAGLSVAVIEAGAISIANMFELNYGIVNGLTALISVGANHTQIGFVNNGKFLYSHEAPVGGDTFTTAIMQALNVPRDSAESLKLSLSAGAHGAPQELVRVVTETNNLIVNDIRQIFNFFATGPDAEGTTGVKYAFLTGGASRSYGLDAAIAAGVSVPVHQANPFQRVEINERHFKLDQAMALSPMFGVAVGLGVREKGDKVAA